MLFNSYRFLLFFPIVAVLYYQIPQKCKKYWLLLASYYFYMCWNPKYAVLIFTATVVTWLGGLIIEKQNNEKMKKLALAGSILCPTVILFCFKYLNFLWESMKRLLGCFGQSFWDCPWSFALPVGISFYTFQVLGYVIDVYRGRIEAERNIIRYSLFVSFFPQLVAGPIERSENLLNQIRAIEKPMPINWERVRDGLVYMLYGYFVKMVLADNLAMYVDKVYEQYYFYGSIELIIAAIFFSIQIYCDFSGYSIIAIGAAEVMGFKLMENFHAPYFATSIKDFWRRWHISLSTWLKDYIYIPLGGNRCSKMRYYSNLMLTFLISGLWHGANWTFVIWGGLHGLYQILGDLLGAFGEKMATFIGINPLEKGYQYIKITLTFVLTTLTWILFRADSFEMVWQYIYAIFTRWNPWVLTDGSLKTVGFHNGVEWIVVIFSIIVLFGIDVILEKRNQRIDEYLCCQGNFFRVLFCICMIFAIAIFGNYGGYQANAFIYFQF